jgi:PAS domain S-box-containing protein
MKEQRHARLVAYGVAVLATGLSVLLRLALFGLVANRSPFITFFPSIILSAYLGGVRPGLLATLLSALAADYFLIEPRGSLWIDDVGEAYALGLFVLTGVALSVWGESRLRSRRRLAASERRFAVTLASIGDAVIATDNQARVTFVNRAAEALTGWPLADAVGRPLAEVFRIVNEQTRQSVEDPAAKVLRSGTVVGLANHTALLARDGREVPIDDCGAPILDARGAVAGVVLVFRDVTERRQAEEAEAIRRANQRMELALRGSNVGVWDHETPDADYGLRRRYYVNVWKQLGYEGSPPDGENPLDAVHPDDRLRVEEEARRYLACESTEYETEARFRHRDGSYRTLLTRGVAVRDAAGKPIRFAGVTVDITQLKLAEDALRESEARFRGTFENAAVGIVHNDPAGHFLRVNQRFCEIVGYSLEELLQKTLQDIIHSEDLAPHIELYTSCFTRGEPPAPGMERRYLRKDGRAVWVEVFVSFQRDASGRPAYAIAAVQDITERKRLEGELRQTTARLGLAMRGSNLSIWECDMPDGRIENSRPTLINVWELMGYDARTSPMDFPSTFALLFHPDDQERVGRELQELFAADGQDYESTYRVRPKDGSTRWHLARGKVLRDPNGKPVRFIGTSTDVTDLKRAQEALRESERRFRTFVDHAADAFFLTDEQGRILDVNFRACESLGYTRDELIGMTPFDFVDLEPTVVEDRIRQFIAGEAVAFDSLHRRKDGTVFPVETRGKSFREGGRQFMVALARDVTDRKRADEAMRLSEQRYRSLIEASAAIVWTLLASGVADKSEQPSWSAFTGQTSDQFAGWGWLDCVHPEDRDHTYRTWTAAVAAGTLYQIEYRVRRRDGAYRNMLTRGVPILASDGNIREWFGTCIDITDLKRLEEELREAKMRAEAANRAKDEFLANVSHEIRTPMSAILGMTELVLDTSLEEDQRQGLKTVKSAADSLLGVINDLLDFSKIEAGKLELVPADFLLREAVGDTLRALAVRAHKKGLELIYQGQPDVPDALVGDTGRLRQVLLNLVGNAVKFTDEGEIVVLVEVEDDKVTRWQGDKVTNLGESPAIEVGGMSGEKGNDLVTLSPCHLVTLSPCHLVTLSPCHLR